LSETPGVHHSLNAKANLGKLNLASIGTGSAPHLAGELFKMTAGVGMIHVPYRSTSQSGALPAPSLLLWGQCESGTVWLLRG
jgi:hypothetical protein